MYNPEVVRIFPYVLLFGSSLYQDLCKLLDKLNKTKGTDNKKKIFSSFLDRWREEHKKLHPTDADTTVNVAYIYMHMQARLHACTFTCMHMYKQILSFCTSTIMCHIH